MTETITKFAMGDAVPEWLITVEPLTSASHKENFRFAVDVDVIETPEIFVVVPRVFGGGHVLIDGSGTHGCKMFSPGKPTRVVVSTIDFFAENVGQLVPLGAAATPPPSPQVDKSYAQVVEDPHPTFWKRLLFVLRGH